MNISPPICLPLFEWLDWKRFFIRRFFKLIHSTIQEFYRRCSRTVDLFFHCWQIPKKKLSKSILFPLRFSCPASYTNRVLFVCAGAFTLGLHQSVSKELGFRQLIHWNLYDGFAYFFYFSIYPEIFVCLILRTYFKSPCNLLLKVLICFLLRVGRGMGIANFRNPLYTSLDFLCHKAEPNYKRNFNAVLSVAHSFLSVCTISTRGA